MIYFDAIRLSGLTDIEIPIIGSSVSEPFQVTAIDGLGPPELELLLAETHTPGGIYVNRRAQGREIVILAGLNPNYQLGQTVSDLRYMLYGLLSPGQDIRDVVTVFLLLDNVPVVKTTGYVKNIEVVPFNKEPQIQITISCLSPYLAALEPKNITNNILGASSWTIDNVGRAPTGISFEAQFVDSAKMFEIWVTDGVKMTFNAHFEIGDVLVVDTNESSRFIGLKKGGVYAQYLEILSNDSQWLYLYGGIHTINIRHQSNISWLKFEYLLQYWGI
jgi:hypothetical protein